MRGWDGRGATLILALVAAGCSRPPEAKRADSSDEAFVPPTDDASRCAGATKKDRATLEFRGAAARHKNIRRVFSLGQSQKGDRVLRCREIDTNLDGVKDVFRTYNQRGLPVAEVADSDYDGEADTWLLFSGTAVSEARFDRDRDGEPDEFRIYSGGRLARARRDTNQDGKIDTWEVYDSGRLRRVGTDDDGDGQVDRWERDQAYERARANERAAEEAKAAAARGDTASGAAGATSGSGRAQTDK